MLQSESALDQYQGNEAELMKVLSNAERTVADIDRDLAEHRSAERYVRLLLLVDRIYQHDAKGYCTSLSLFVCS